MNSLAWSALAATALVPVVVPLDSKRHEPVSVIERRPLAGVGEATLQGKVVEVDRATGRLALTTETGPLVFHVPPPDLAEVHVGDVLEVVLLEAPDHEREEGDPAP